MNTLNVAMLLEHAARVAPHQTFVIEEHQRFSFGEVESEACRVANALAGLGVRSGDRVALFLPNTSMFVIAYYGALKLGAIPVPLNVASPGPELARLLADAEATILIAYEPFMAAAAEAINVNQDRCRLLIANSPGSDACPPGTQRLADLMRDAADNFVTALTRPDDTAMILYTSGTAGQPKGAMLTHFNINFFAQLLAHDLWQLTADDVMLMVAPAAHIFGQSMINVACVAQARLSLMAKFDLPKFLNTIERDRVTFFAGVPTLGHYLLNASGLDRCDLSSLRVVMLSGAAVPPDLIRSVRARFQVDVITGYGMTEAVPITFVTAVEMARAPIGSVGQAVWGTAVMIVDDAGLRVPIGELGEIVVRGPQVFCGYYRRPLETAAAQRDDWFHTGDVGHVDEAGHLFIVDRIKDMIKRSGYAVYPAEVERVLVEHPAVAEAAVVGVPDAAVGEEIKACVVLKLGAAVTPDELIEHCKQQLAAYKCPRIVEVRDSLLKNPAGKIVRSTLRQA